MGQGGDGVEGAGMRERVERRGSERVWERGMRERI